MVQCIRFRADIDLQLLHFSTDFSKTPHVCFQPLSSPSEKKKTTLSLVCQVAFLRLGVSTGRSKPQHVQSWALKKKKEKHGIYWKQISHFQTICHGLDRLNPLNNIKQVPALDAKKSSLACCDAAQTCVTMKEGWMISYAWWKSKEKRIRAPV